MLSLPVDNCLISFVTGYIKLGQPTGRTLVTEDGGIYEEYGPTYEMNDDHTVRKVIPWEGPYLVIYYK